MNTACSTGRTEKHPCKWSASCIAVIAVFLELPWDKEGIRVPELFALCFLNKFFLDCFLQFKDTKIFCMNENNGTEFFQKTLFLSSLLLSTIDWWTAFPLLPDLPLRARMLLNFSDGNVEGTIKVSNGVSPFVIQRKGGLFGSLLLDAFL